MPGASACGELLVPPNKVTMYSNEPELIPVFEKDASFLSLLLFAANSKSSPPSRISMLVTVEDAFGPVTVGADTVKRVKEAVE